MTDVFSGIFTNTANAIHNRQAAQALAGNDYAGAMSNLARIGNIDGVNRLRTQQRTEQAEVQKAQQEKAARSVAFARQATRAINRTMQEGGDPLATFDQIAPAMQSLGASPEEVNQYRLQLIHNPQGFLQAVGSILDAEERKLQVVNFGSGLGAAVVDERTGQEVNRINPSYRPVGDVLYDPAKGEVVFDARQPTYQTIRNADGSTSVVAIDPNPIAGGAPSAPAVAGAGSGRSVGERNNNQGNIRDVGQFAGNPAYLGTGENGFARFSTPEAGNAAQEQQLNLYYTGRSRHTPNGPVQSIGGIIDIYAPQGPENSAASVANYKSYVASRLGIGQNDTIPQSMIPQLAQAMREFETGNVVRAPRSRPSAQGGTRVVAQGAPETRGTEYTMLTAEEKRSAGLPEAGTFQRNNRTGQITAVAGGGGQANDRKSEADLRKEFNARAEVKDFNTIRSAYQNVRSASQNPSAAGDLSMIFAYMKLLDPGSVVREQEFANAQNAAGVPDQVRNMYNRALNGQRLNPTQRQDFVSQAERLYASRRQTYDQIVGEYRGYAQYYGLNPDRIVSNRDEQPRGGPRLSFQPSQQQLGWVRQNNPSSGAPVGSAQNPRLINPQSPTQSFNNIRSGQYFVAPDGQLRRKP